MSAAAESDQEPLPRAEQLLFWQAMSQERVAFDTMMWQTPALGMTAQAFLITLALARDSTPDARLIAALLSLILALMAIQLMAKHRRNEMLTALSLERMEIALGFQRPPIYSLPHGGKRPEQDLESADRRLRRSTPFVPTFWSFSSYELWMMGLGLFALASLAIIVIVLCGDSSGLF